MRRNSRRGVLLPVRQIQDIVDKIAGIINVEFGVMDQSGYIIACTDSEKIDTRNDKIQQILGSNEAVIIIEGMAYEKIYIKNMPEYIVFIKNENEECVKYLSLIALNISGACGTGDDKLDKITFVKNIIMDNILPGEVLVKAKQLHLDTDVFRVVFLIKSKEQSGMLLYDVIQNLFPNKSKDFVIMVDEYSVVLIKEIKNPNNKNEIQKTSKIIIDMLVSELMVKAVVGIGTVVNNIRDIGRSYKEAQMALLIGSVFENDKFIINYNKLGIGRLIYQLPITLCNMFLKEVFRDGSFESFDSETMLTIQKFFENNLNVSQTSRQLHVHRNTLIYRLEKIEKITGLDLKKFEDAIILKVAMMVKKYLDSCENTS